MTVTDPRRITRSGFLTDYDRLKKADQSWSYAKDAFDEWSMLVAQRFEDLQVGTPAK